MRQAGDIRFSRLLYVLSPMTSNCLSTAYRALVLIRLLRYDVTVQFRDLILQLLSHAFFR